jgi:hypothetical protein
VIIGEVKDELILSPADIQSMPSFFIRNVPVIPERVRDRKDEEKVSQINFRGVLLRDLLYKAGMKYERKWEPGVFVRVSDIYGGEVVFSFGEIFYSSIGRSALTAYERNDKACLPTLVVATDIHDGVVGPMGNPDLEEESAIKVEIGSYFIVSPKFHLGGAVFYSRVTNMINFDNLIGRFEQYPKASMKGFELTSNIYIAESTEGYISYTFLRSRALDSVTIENQYFPSLTYRPDELPYRPEHQIDLEFRHKLGFGLDAAFNGMYVSESTYYDHADSEDNTVMVSVKGKLADYFIANIKLSQKIVGEFGLYFAIENLGNAEYQTLYLYPSAGRTYKGGLSFNM